jgi:hypothetical protein
LRGQRAAIAVDQRQINLQLTQPNSTQLNPTQPNSTQPHPTPPNPAHAELVEALLSVNIGIGRMGMMLRQAQHERVGGVSVELCEVWIASLRSQ